MTALLAALALSGAARAEAPALEPGRVAGQAALSAGLGAGLGWAAAKPGSDAHIRCGLGQLEYAVNGEDPPGSCRGEAALMWGGLWLGLGAGSAAGAWMIGEIGGQTVDKPAVWLGAAGGAAAGVGLLVALDRLDLDSEPALYAPLALAPAGATWMAVRTRRYDEPPAALSLPLPALLPDAAGGWQPGVTVSGRF